MKTLRNFASSLRMIFSEGMGKNELTMTFERSMLDLLLHDIDRALGKQANSAATATHFEETKRGVEDWSRERGIHNADPAKQMLKLTEEVGELAGAIARNHEADTADAIGDILVVLTILCQQTGFDIEKCFDIAYQTIKSRKGKTVNGVFVKEADLNGD